MAVQHDIKELLSLPEKERKKRAHFDFSPACSTCEYSHYNHMDWACNLLGFTFMQDDKMDRMSCDFYEEHEKESSWGYQKDFH